MYTTISEVRTRGGGSFLSTTKVPDSIIRGKIEEAGSTINGEISCRYVLPIKYHRSNTADFEGTATAGGTVSITVNSVAYSYTASIGDTGSLIADKIREQAVDSDDFITDGVGMGQMVTLVSKTDNDDLTTANTEVNITSTATVAGIVITEGVRTDRYTPSLREMTTRLAVAYLYQKYFGVEVQNSNQDGYVLEEKVFLDLKKIQLTSKEGTYRKLYDEVTKQELATCNCSYPRYFPNESGVDANGESTLYKAGINTQY